MIVFFHSTRRVFMEMNKEFAKKRLMFIQKEDYNYLIYNLLLILETLGCNNESTAFHDFRKIAYLIDFISSSKVVDNYSQDELGIIYSKSQLKKKLLSHVLVILKNKEYIDISINRVHKSFDIWLIKDNIPQNFLGNDIFENEIKNILCLKKQIKRLRGVTIKNMVDCIFTTKNVLTWEI
jgi:hypothetical protein